MANVLPQLSILEAGRPGRRTGLVGAGPQGRVWRYRQAGATDTQGRQRSGGVESRGATERTGEPGAPMGPHLESCFQSQHLIPKDRADEKGAREGQ